MAFGSILEPTQIQLAISFLKLKKRSGVYRIYFFPPLDLQFSRVRHCQVFRVMKNWRQRPPSFSLFVFSNSLFSISTSLSCCSVIYNIVRVPLRLFSFFFFCLSPCTSTPLWLIRLFIYLSVVHFCTHKPLDVWVRPKMLKTFTFPRVFFNRRLLLSQFHQVPSLQLFVELIKTLHIGHIQNIWWF